MMRSFPPHTAVILNSFQDPFLGTDRSTVGRQGRAVWPLSARIGRAARWMLKQVQHDGLGEAAE